MLFMLHCHATAQVTPPNTDVAGAGAGGNSAQRATINQATGTISYAVPLATLSEGPLALNLAASYSSSGHRVRDKGGNLGLGWHLSTGLSLTREIRGIPDDAAQGSWHQGIDVSTAGKRQEALEGKRDAEADIFRYQVIGAAGAFYVVNDGGSPVIEQVPLTDNLIVPIVEAGTYVGFVITTPDGVSCTFGGIRNTNSVITPLTAMASVNGPSEWQGYIIGGTPYIDFRNWFAVEYYPVKITAITNASIEFSYTASTRFAKDIWVPVTYGVATTSGVHNSDWAQDFSVSQKLELVSISGIQGKQKIDFEFQDWGNWDFRVISNIKQNVGPSPTSVRFEYDSFITAPKVGHYSVSDYPTTVSLPSLKRIIPYATWHAQGSDYMEHYDFNYYYDPASPLSYVLPQMVWYNSWESHYTEHDYYGYASKRHTDNGLPLLVFGQSSPGTGDREPVPASAKKTLLKSIKEPYTGLTTIDYEPHERAVTTASVVSLNAWCEPTLTCTECTIGSCAQQSAPQTFWVDAQSMEGATIRVQTSYTDHPGSFYYNARLKLLNVSTGQAGNDITWTMSSNAHATQDLDAILSLSFGTNFGSGQYRAELSINRGNDPNPSPTPNTLTATITITTSSFLHNEIVPGLRVKSIKFDDRNGNLSETKYTYTRASAGLPNRSSGMTVGKPEFYRFSPNGSTVFYSSESANSQSFSSGAYVIYREISEESVGLGHTVSVYDPPFETVNSSASTGILPRPIYEPGEGRLLTRNYFALGATLPIRTESYTYALLDVQSPATQSYTRIVNGSTGSPDFKVYLHPRTLAQRLQSLTLFEDGRQTVTTFTYHSAFLDATPVQVHTSYPDGSTSTQQTRYIRDYDGEAAIKQELTLLHATRIPFETSTLRNGAFLSKASTYFGFYQPGGAPSSSNCTNCRVAPWRLFITGYPVNASGAGTTTTEQMWIMTKEIFEIFPDGSPRSYRNHGDDYTTTLELQDGLVTKVTHGPAITTYQYQHRQLTSTTDPNGRTTNYEYDVQNRLRLKTSTCDGASTEYQYNPVLPTSAGPFASTVEIYRSSASAPRQHTWRTYDGAGRVIQTVSTGISDTAPDAGANGVGYILAQTLYDAFGRVRTSYEPITVNAAFLNWGHQVVSMPSNARSVTMSYESSPRSRLLSETLHNGYQTTYQYGYNTAVITGVGLQSSYAPGSLTSIKKVDFEGYVSESLADAAGSPVLTRRFAAGSATAYDEVYYGYDVKNQLRKVVPGLMAVSIPTRHTLYTYDALGRKLSHQDPGRGEDNYTYDNAGRIETLSTPYTRAISPDTRFRYSYNAFGQPSRNWLTATTGSTPPPLTERTEEFEYYTTAGTSSYLQVKTHWTWMLDNSAELITRTHASSSTCGRAGTFTEVGLTHAGTQFQTSSTSTYDSWNRPAATTVTHILPGRQVQAVSTPNYRADHSIGDVHYALSAKLATGTFTPKYAGTAYEVWHTAHGELQWRKDFGNGSVALQKTDYSYDPLGRIIAINQPLYTNPISLPTALITASGGTTQRNEPTWSGALTAQSDLDLRDLFHEAIRYETRSQGGGFPGPIVHRGLIQETVKESLGRRPVHESYKYDAQLRLIGFEAQEQVSATATTISPYAHSRHARAGYAYDSWNRLTALQRFGYQNSSAPVDELFDNLQHRYNNPALNAPTQVFDYARRSRGHRNTSGDSAPKTRYSYNSAGDISTDEDKGLTYAYNALGLVSSITRSDDAALTYRYAADGTLLASTETNYSGTVLSRHFYLGGHRYEAVAAETYLQTPYGATLLDAGLAAKHVGFQTDHLGNVVLAYADLDADGVINPRTEILEESRYYPYGLKQEIYNRQSMSLPFGYNGAESQDRFGLHLTMYRTMAPEVAFWGQTDPKAEWDYATSPYTSMRGNPISYNDPDGDFWHIVAGAVIGAGINVFTHWDDITAGGKVNWGEFGKAAGIGAAAGAVGAATGGAALGAAGLSATSVAGGALAGGAGAATSSPILGVGNNIAFNDPYSLKQWGVDVAFGIGIGGVTGGVANLIKNAQPGATPTNFWTDKALAPGRNRWSFNNTPKGSEWGPKSFVSESNSLKSFDAEYVKDITRSSRGSRSVPNFEVWDKSANDAWKAFTGEALDLTNNARPGFLLEGGSRMQFYPGAASTQGPTIAHFNGVGELLWKIRFPRIY